MNFTPLESVTTPVRKKLYCAIVQFQLDTSSTVVQSHIDNHYIHHILLIYTLIYSGKIPWHSRKKFITIYRARTITLSSLIQSNVGSDLKCRCSVLYCTVIYPLRWSTNGPLQSHYHRTSVPGNSWDISTMYSGPIWCKPVSSKSNTTRIWRSISMTEKSRVISRANSTDLYISIVGYDSTIQTEVDVCDGSIDMV